MEKKGQAAMEFLMTYGWAILAAIIAIGALAYFGVFSPGKFTSDACIVNAPFNCDEFALGTNVEMTLRNGGGYGYTISSVNIEGCTPATPAEAVADGSVSSAITVTCGFSSGDKVNSDIAINYTKTDGGTITQTATGTIRGTVP